MDASEARADNALAAAAKATLREEVPHPTAADGTSSCDGIRRRKAWRSGLGLVSLCRLPIEPVAASRLPIASVGILPTNKCVASVDFLYQAAALRARATMLYLPLFVALKLPLPIHGIP